ncbi:hypothetical protein F2Q69_00023248 [Brassica cretica]|uniref:Uncharacterized protein n=1 Tax=Brassica cretica TaxID=69181 RepID=A0A8S9QJP9_BRACR|nr:hypothetical protein F2Q69_00023248 [Brassica cretica]
MSLSRMIKTPSGLDMVNDSKNRSRKSLPCPKQRLRELFKGNSTWSRVVQLLKDFLSPRSSPHLKNWGATVGTGSHTKYPTKRIRKPISDTKVFLHEEFSNGVINATMFLSSLRYASSIMNLTSHSSTNESTSRSKTIEPTPSLETDDANVSLETTKLMSISRLMKSLSRHKRSDQAAVVLIHNNETESRRLLPSYSIDVEDKRSNHQI